MITKYISFLLGLDTFLGIIDSVFGHSSWKLRSYQKPARSSWSQLQSVNESAPLNLHQLLLTNEVQFSTQKCFHLVCLFKASKAGKSDRSKDVCKRTLIRPIRWLSRHLISAINLIGSIINFFRWLMPCPSMGPK